VTWVSLFNLIMIPFNACFDIIGRPVLEGVSVLDVLVAFIIVLCLIKMVIPVAHTSMNAGFDVSDAQKREAERADQRARDREQHIKDQKDMTKWRYQYNHDKDFRRKEDLSE